MGPPFYNQPPGSRLLCAFVPAVGGAESYIVDCSLAEPARRELARAREALRSDQSEVNIRAFENARNEVAKWETIALAGRGMAGGSILDTLLNRGSLPRANVSAAEGERGRLVRALTRAPPAPRVPKRKLTPKKAGEGDK